jgi:hypothetical protein
MYTVAIELGSTSTAIAYATASQCSATSAYVKSLIKAPTSVLLHNDGRFLKFGREAESKYAECLIASAPGEELPCQLFRRFTLLPREMGGRFLTATSLTGKEHCLTDLIVQYLASLKRLVAEKLSAVDQRIDTSKFQWVLVVQSNCSDEHKTFVRKAAVEAGIATSVDSERLLLVSEADSAVQMNHPASPHLSQGNRFLVLNCGDSAFDIRYYGVNSVAPLELSACTAYDRGVGGGDTVDAGFQNLLSELLGPELYQPAEYPYEFYTIKEEFDKIKVLFDPSKDPSTLLVIDVLERKSQLCDLAEVWNGNHPEKPILRSPVLRVGLLAMSKELMLSLFEHALSQIVSETAKELSKCSGVGHILLTGDFAATKALRDRVMAEFHGKKGVQVILPDNPGLSHVYGALNYALYGDEVRLDNVPSL